MREVLQGRYFYKAARKIESLDQFRRFLKCRENLFLENRRAFYLDAFVEFPKDLVDASKAECMDCIFCRFALI